MQLGFADQSHLSRQFKQSYGVSPGEYRRACADF
jgi:AraC-like DNA-binding protein